MSSTRRTVLITGCSEEGTGACLALAFHTAGLKIIATARDPSKMRSLERAGIETLTLDVQSESSIEQCIGGLSSLDILINNAGAGGRSSMTDMNIAEAKVMFDLNVWGPVAVMQACIPLLIKSSQPVIVNHTSGASVIPVPFHMAYNSSKAAQVMITDTARLELEAFNIKFVELKTGLVRTNFSNNINIDSKPVLPEDSIYQPAREQMESILGSRLSDGKGMDPDEWARRTVRDVLKANPPKQIYRGDGAWFARIVPMLPFGFFDAKLKQTTGLDKVEQQSLQTRKRV